MEIRDEDARMEGGVKKFVSLYFTVLNEVNAYRISLRVNVSSQPSI